MINLLNLDQLAHKARIEDNELALIILDKMEEEIENAVEEATAKNDADYSYEIFDAVQTIEFFFFFFFFFRGFVWTPTLTLSLFVKSR